MTTARQFQHAICRIPPLSMATGITTQHDKVDPVLAREQHQHYVAHLRECGVNVIVLEPEEGLPDSHFVEDAAIVHAGVAILTCPGATARRKEVAAIKPALESILHVTELGGSDDALLDGGDVLMSGHQVYIGLSHRTSLAGAKRLEAILREIDPALHVSMIAFEGVLHLKSGMTALNEACFLGNPRMRVNQSQIQASIQWLPDAEGYAANTLTVNGTTLYFAESRSLDAIIRAQSLTPAPMNMSEFRKMDGSFTCLSLLW